MTLARAISLAVTVAFAVFVAAVFAFRVPLGWAVLLGLPAGALVFSGGRLSGTFDADWTAEPEPQAASVTLHASFLTERLERSAIDQYRFVSRVQPRLRRVAEAVVRGRLGSDVDVRDPRARELLGADLHRLVTARDAQLPPAKTFAALMRRLEEL